MIENILKFPRRKGEFVENNHVFSIFRWVLRVLAQIPFFPKRYFCTICGKRSIFFRSAGHNYESLTRLNIIGGGLRKNVKCPICGAIDRDRWINYVLEHFTDVYFNADNHILHFAPERIISKKIRKVCSDYITADIQPHVADEVVDITNIKYENRSFDYIIANHVLEHIKDEEKAIEEIKRCLKTNGKAIISFPISKVLITKEESDRLSEEQRIKEFGQKDHCRLYGTDVVEHFEKYNVHISEYNVNTFLSDSEISTYKYLPDDRVYILTL